MIETIHDLEAIREALQLPTWHFGPFNRWYAWTFICNYISTFLTIISRSRAAASNYTETPFCIYHPAHPQFHYMQKLIENLKALTLQMKNGKNYLLREQNYHCINQKTTTLIFVNQSIKQCPLAG